MRDIAVEFLAFKGCPHAPVMRQRLEEALRVLGKTVTPIEVDLELLSQAGDPRSGFGSPTILVDGRDLFGMESPTVPSKPSCRYYRPALPSTADIIERLRVRIERPE